MAGDPFKKVSAGQPLKIPAQTFNTFLDAARDFKERQRSTTAPELAESPPYIPVKIKNNSGADRDRFDVLGLGPPLFDPTDNIDEFKNHFVFSGVEPSCHHGRFVVLTRSIPAGKIGEGVLWGVTPVKINVTTLDPQYQFADVEDDEFSRLRMVRNGTARILWKEPGTGVVWALVCLGNPVALPDESTGDSSASASANCDGPCGPGMVEIEVGVQTMCDGGDLVVCQRKLCQPSDWVGPADCGDLGDDSGSGSEVSGGGGGGGGGGVVVDCCGNALPDTLYVSTSGSGTCGVISAAPITWNGSRWVGSTAFGTCGRTISFEFYCAGTTLNDLKLDVSYSDACMSPQTLNFQFGACDPLDVRFRQNVNQACYSSPGAGFIWFNFDVTE